MYRVLSEIVGYKLVARDGDVGRCEDFLFDDRRWTLRYLVADTGSWLSNHKVLVAPRLLNAPDWPSRALEARATRAVIKDSPELEQDLPVSKQHDAKPFMQGGWQQVEYGMALWGAAPQPYLSQSTGTATSTAEDEGDPHLRSFKEVTGYTIRARDGDIGQISDLIVDDETWMIRYLVVDTRKWIPGRKVVLSPFWVDSIEWGDRRVVLDVTREHVKGSPDFIPDEPVNREYEARLYDYYGRPHDWD